MWCPCVRALACRPSSLLKGPEKLGLVAINTRAGEMGRRRQGTGGCSLQLSSWFNKRPKVELCLFNGYQQLVFAFLLLSQPPRLS